MQLEVPDEIMIGDDFDVTVQVTNYSEGSREVVVQIHGRAVQSTGAPGQLVKSEEIALKVDGLQGMEGANISTRDARSLSSSLLE